MVRLVYSNRMEELLSELGGRVRGQQARDGALVPVRIVVPSRSLENYLRLGIAREHGIAANLDVDRLTGFAARTAAPSGARVADASAIEAMALELLLDDAAIDAADLLPVKGYLRAAGEAPDAIDLRRVQLASRIGRLFEEYTYSRAEMLRAWNGGTIFGASLAETESWQRHLWLAMFGSEGIAHRGPVRRVPLHEAVDAASPTVAWPATVHVFGFAHVARTFYRLFESAGRGTDVVIYTLTPCEGFWEDVDPRDPPLLRLWAHAGRQNVRTLNALAAFDHDDRFVDPAGSGEATVLRTLQRDLMHRRVGRLPPSDASLTVLEHASVRRECEAVASAIWQAVRADASMSFDSVTVLVPQGEAAAYVAHLGAAFHEAHDIPFQTLGLPGAAPGRIAEAIDRLLSLPLGRFTRPEVLELLLHPSFVASVGDADPEADPARWVAWCEALGIVHGVDHGDHDETYIEHDILNWDQGLRRLALGTFMAGDASGDRTPFVAGDQAYVPLEVAGTEMHDVATFGRLVRSLFADARFFRQSVLVPREWADRLSALVETYVAPTSDAEADELARRLRQIASIADVDLGGRSIGYRIARELARARLAVTGGSRGGAGVVVSTIGAARGIPARVVFACGMAEGRFPSSDAEDRLDLRWADRREGDVTARERDKYAFLEVLTGARDRLVLSFVSRDPLTGDPLASSSVVQELLHTLASGYGCDAATLRQRHPLRRWDPVYFPEFFGRKDAPIGTLELPEAAAEAATVALRQHAERQGAHRSLHDIVARAEQGDPAWSALADHLRVARLPEAPPRSDARVVVPVHALVKFLELALQGWAQFRLGLDEADADDLTSRDNEPFETAPRDETLLLREVLLEAADRGVPVEQAYDTIARDRELRGQGPTGVFATGERGDHLRALGEWCGGLRQHQVAVESLRIHRFGRGGEHTRAHEVHEPLIVDVAMDDAAGVLRSVRVELNGRTLPIGGSDPTSVVLAKRGNESMEEWGTAGRRRSILRAFVDYAVLCAAGVDAGEGHASLLVVATREKTVIERTSFEPLSADAAKRWLRGLLGELLGAPHAYFLPCEAVFVHHARGDAGPLLPVLEEARDKLGNGDGPPALRSAYGPVPRPQNYPLPSEPAARSMVDRRYSLLLGARMEKR